MYRLYLRTGSLWIVLTSKWKTCVFHAGDVLGVLTLNDFSASIGRVDGLRCLCFHVWTQKYRNCWGQSSNCPCNVQESAPYRSLSFHRDNRWRENFILMFMLPVSQLNKRTPTCELTGPNTSGISSHHSSVSYFTSNQKPGSNRMHCFENVRRLRQ